ncbi:8-oxo-dGDP phosphatase nudt18 [Clonorchis sinensis]|uniref:8-oxo-dGDP phosphatase nudt18 n=3 Tax=Clonorchis sinensis TaxID=79923 RepID=A0A8T1MIC5_CLOSI|nr:8-oxo-dGDP phosphatase nudt18 [Clonorchis sinensis]GAA52725.1 nucleoside diphosphate-linked moiety X motif 18 [Clonorchis sinensis]
MDYDVALPSRAYHPRVKENLCVIVVGLVMRADKVLLIQEAKNSCRGLYFLPAGRLEVNETLLDGVRREVLEESGLVFEPRRCVLVEINGPFWISITFLGDVIGGSLKANADSESLGAGWFSLDQIREAERAWVQNRRSESSANRSESEFSSFALRAAVLHMIEAGLRYLSANRSCPDLPYTLTSCIHCILYQLAIVSAGKSDSHSPASPTHLLLSGSRLPAFRLNGGHPVEMIDKFIQSLFSTDLNTANSNLTHSWDTENISVLCVAVTPRSPSNDPNQADGLLVTLRIIHLARFLPTPRHGYQWHELQSLDKLLQPLAQLVSLPFNTDLLPPYLYHSVHRMNPAMVKKANKL